MNEQLKKLNDMMPEEYRINITDEASFEEVLHLIKKQMDKYRDDNWTKEK